jgi:hypothetical protein
MKQKTRPLFPLVPKLHLGTQPEAALREPALLRNFYVSEATFRNGIAVTGAFPNGVWEREKKRKLGDL